MFIFYKLQRSQDSSLNQFSKFLLSLFSFNPNQFTSNSPFLTENALKILFINIFLLIIIRIELCIKKLRISNVVMMWLKIIVMVSSSIKLISVKNVLSVASTESKIKTNDTSAQDALMVTNQLTMLAQLFLSIHVHNKSTVHTTTPIVMTIFILSLKRRQLVLTNLKQLEILLMF